MHNVARESKRERIPSVLDDVVLPVEIEGFLEQLRGQDHLSTAYPAYTVEQREKIWGVDPNWGDYEVAWTFDGCDDGPVYERPPDDTPGLEEVYFRWQWQYVNVHFTRKAAELYIAQNRHNLCEPRVFITSQHGCWEWVEILKLLGQDGR